MKPPIISVNIYTPLNQTDFMFYRRVIADSYSHTIGAFGGYDTAAFTIACTQTEAEDWLEDGLNRHVKCYSPSLEIIWEGFVNEIRVNLAPLTVSLGPLMDIANRVLVSYTPVVHGDDGDVTGAQTWTDPADDLDSQAKYGIVVKALTGITDTAGNSDYIRDVYLADTAWPKPTESFNSGGDRDVSVTLNCLGYGHRLDYILIVPDTGTTTLSQKIIDIIGENPNIAWLNFDTAAMDANGLTVPADESQGRKAIEAIRELVGYGDGTNRWLFYVLADLNCYYHIAPTAVEYRANILERGAIVSSATQATVDPWDILPGRWLAFNDFLVGRNVKEGRIDPRIMFIERVTYRAPFGLQLQGGIVDTISQVLGGISLGTSGGGGPGFAHS